MSVIVYSIYPRELRAKRLFASATYVMPAATKGGIQKLVVEDATVHERFITGGATIPRTIPAQQIAEDLVREWTLLMALENRPDATPGVWIHPNAGLSDRQVMSSTIYKEQVDKQDGYFRHYIDFADSLEHNGRRHDIEPEAYVAAEWFGITGKAWQVEHKTGEIVNCPFCGSSIARVVVKCPVCMEIVDAQRYKQLQAGLADPGKGESAKPPQPELATAAK